MQRRSRPDGQRSSVARQQHLWLQLGKRAD